MIRQIIIIGAGGFIGSIARFLTSKYVHLFVNTPFPLGTFIVNILGCFLIGLFYGLAERHQLLSVEWRIFLTVGFCGGFTTFSTFANEGLTMMRSGEFMLLLLYTGLSVFLGILFTYLGAMLSKIMI